MEETPSSALRFWDGGVVDRAWDEMDLAAVQPYWLTGQFPLSRLPQVAQNEIEHGRRGDAVLMLLALDVPDNRAPQFLQAYRAAVHGLVLRALREVSVPEMAVDEAWRQVIREEAELVVNGDPDERAVGAHNLSWMYRKTRLHALQEFNALDLEAENYWDAEVYGPINHARVEAAERLLYVLRSSGG